MALTKPKSTSFDITAGSLSSAQIKALGIETASFADLAVTLDKANLTGASYPGFEEDVALLGFKVASNGSLGKYNLIDQAVDAFEDASGVDASASTDEIRNTAGKYYTGVVAGNYFGDGTLGNCTFGTGGVTQSSNTVDIDTVLTTGSESGGPGSSSYGTGVPNSSACYETTVLSTSGTYDGDMWVGNFKDLTIDSSITLTTNRACRGMFLYVDGNCVINGALSMTSRGGLSNPTTSGGSDTSAVATNGLQLGLVTSGGSSTFTNDGSSFAGAGTTVKTAIANQDNISGNGTILTISKAGAAGGAAQAKSGPYGGPTMTFELQGNDGAAGSTGGVTISTGGGGNGGLKLYGQYSVSASSGKGGDGGSFSGGAGSGAAQNYSMGAAPAGVAGGDYGGAGSNAIGQGYGNFYGGAGGGAGNPGGTGTAHSSYTADSGGSGVGGIIWLIVKGNLTIGGSGSVEAKGAASGGTNAPDGYSGGSSGGGAAMVGYAGTLSNSGTISAAGGVSPTPNMKRGGHGGAGGTHSLQIAAGSSYNNMTLVSNSTTAQAAPTKGDMVMTYSNGAGTAVINTDITAEFSADNGSTWTAMTLASQGTTGGHTILSAHDVTRTSTSGTSMRYRIKTLNQGASKDTRVHAVSLGWS